MAVISDLIAARQARRAALTGQGAATPGTAARGPAVPVSAPPDDASWPLVLVVDDSATIRKIVEVTLRRERFRVVCVGDGLSALAAIADRCPQLILLDVTLPGMDGYQICHVIRQ